jgi:hypothetical protein
LPDAVRDSQGIDHPLDVPPSRLVDQLSDLDEVAKDLTNKEKIASGLVVHSARHDVGEGAARCFGKVLSDLGEAQPIER